MAQVFSSPTDRHRHARSIGNMEFPPMTSAPTIDMLPNPNFSFPALPSNPQHDRLHSTPTASTGRGTLAHRRAVSNLPSFSFNAADTSGLSYTTSSPSPPKTPEENVFTPPRRGHRRGASEFVGGDSRKGVEGALSSSPTKSDALPIPVSGPPAGRRGHVHRRSAAMSSHDVTTIMGTPDAQPRLSTSLPNTPLELPGQAQPLDRSKTSFSDAIDQRFPFGAPLEQSSSRPQSRATVQFDDHVQIIPRPRPLSTISSGTESSSVSTVRGHSVNNSISSVLNPSAQGQPTPRIPTAATEDEPRSRPTSAAKPSRRVEKEGQWLRRSVSEQGSDRPLSESAAQSGHVSFAQSKSPFKTHEQRDSYRKRDSIGHVLGLGRRSSEPLLSTKADAPSRLSTISLEESATPQSINTKDSRNAEQKSSTRRLKSWAVSKISKRLRDPKKSIADRTEHCTARPKSAMELSNPLPAVTTPPMAETDLDAVFGSPEAEGFSRAQTPPSTQIHIFTPSPIQFRSPFGPDEDSGTILDLDAALGPLRTPQSSSSQRMRKELHSSRLNRDFSGYGGHYHRRAESAPVLPPFESNRFSTQAAPSMADVFEEEEYDEAVTEGVAPLDVSGVAPDEEPGVGIHVVDSDDSTSVSTLNWGVDDALGIQPVDGEHDRPAAYGNLSTRLAVSSLERRPSSIIEQTIIEESSPVDGIEIVESFEEPRTSSLTKSSDSSETPTILATSHTESLNPVDPSQMLMTPDTHQTSTFSSPDFGRYQGSFDTSRLGTSASSMTDNRTVSSCATGEPVIDHRVSVDDIPSLTSSRSTMMSTIHANTSRRDFSAPSGEAIPRNLNLDPTVAAERRRKRASIQSLSQLMGHSFGPRSRGSDSSLKRPQTAVDASSQTSTTRKEPNRLKKLMFWRSKNMSKSSLHMES